MSEFDKLRALLDVKPGEPQPPTKAAPRKNEALQARSRRRRRWLVVLLVILALDALYLAVRTLIG